MHDKAIESLQTNVSPSMAFMANEKRPPAVSIIIVTRNGIRDTVRCLRSVQQHTDVPFEVIIVDNASSDATVRYFSQIPFVRLYRFSENRGFAAGVNEGLRRARGKEIVLLNNDTLVFSDWLKRLRRHLHMHPDCALVGPVSNRVIKEQMLTPPQTLHNPRDLQRFAALQAEKEEGKSIECDKLSGLCLLFNRRLVEEIGGFDERFFPGQFEDLDFSLRVLIAGKHLRIARDVYIHHFGNQSFRREKFSVPRVYTLNRKKFIHKWGKIDRDFRRLAEKEKPFRKERHFVALYHSNQ